MIYADNAATTALHPDALRAMLPFLTEVQGNPGSLHEAGYGAARAIAAAREDVASCLGCRPREVYFTSGGTEANNQALLTAAVWGRSRGRLHVVSTAFEHPSVLRFLDVLKSMGFSVTLVAPDSQGLVSVDAVRAALRPDTCVASVMAVNNEVGTIQPVREIAEACRADGVLVHTDAVQAVGHLPVDVRAWGVDLLTLSAHKFQGPKGVGALVCRGDLEPASLIRGGGQERGHRAGTENVAGIVGLSSALSRSHDLMERDAAYLQGLRNVLVTGLSAVPGCHLTVDSTRCVPGIVHACFEGVHRESLLVLLDRRGICASAGSACSSKVLESSHVLRSMGVPAGLAQGALRLSLGPGSTEAEVREIVRTVGETVAELRRGQGGDVR